MQFFRAKQAMKNNVRIDPADDTRGYNFENFTSINNYIEPY